MLRRSSLRRKTRLCQRRLKPRRSDRTRDRDYLARVRQLPCCALGLSYCDGPIEADHMGERPLGRKCSDYETAPLCRRHHRQRTDKVGPFADWTRDEMRRWMGAMVAETRLALGYKEAARAEAGHHRRRASR